MAIRNSEHRQHIDGKNPIKMTINKQVATQCEKIAGTCTMLVLGILLLALLGLAPGCRDNSKSEDQRNTVNNSTERLKQLIHLPAEVKYCEWQTGKRAPHGDDWWLAAVLEVESERIPAFLQGTVTEEVFETPPGLELISSFAALKSMGEGQPAEANRIRLVTKTYGVDAYVSSPLLHGKAVRMSSNQVFVVLWTN